MKYTDPDGRITRDDEVKKLVDNIGNNTNSFVPQALTTDLINSGWTYIGNDQKEVQQTNEEIKLLADDQNTMVDSWQTKKSVTETQVKEIEISDQLKNAMKIYSDNILGAKHSDESENNSGRTKSSSKTKEYNLRIYTATNIDPNTGKEGPVFRSFIDINDDGNVDFSTWGIKGGINEN